MNDTVKNPKTAIDTLLETDRQIGEISVKPITLGRYALLELVRSPFLFREIKFTISSLVPSFYVMTQDFDRLKGYNSKNIDSLIDKAMEWAEGQSLEKSSGIITAIFDSLGLVNKTAPNVTDENNTKKAEAQVPTVS